MCVYAIHVPTCLYLGKQTQPEASTVLQYLSREASSKADNINKENDCATLRSKSLSHFFNFLSLKAFPDSNNISFALMFQAHYHHRLKPW